MFKVFTSIMPSCQWIPKDIRYNESLK